MGETPGKKTQKFPAALACVDGVVGKKQLPVVSISPSVWILCVCLCVCAVCGGVCDVACRSICSIVRKRSQRKCTEAAGWTNNQCNYGRQIVFVINGFTRSVYLIRFTKKKNHHSFPAILFISFFLFPFSFNFWSFHWSVFFSFSPGHRFYAGDIFVLFCS